MKVAIKSMSTMDWSTMGNLFITVMCNDWDGMVAPAIVAVVVSSMVSERLSVVGITMACLMALLGVFGVTVSAVVRQLVASLVSVMGVLVAMRIVRGSFVVLALYLVVSVSLLIAVTLIPFVVALVVVLLVRIVLCYLAAVRLVRSNGMVAVFGVSLVTTFLVRTVVAVTMSSMSGIQIFVSTVVRVMVAQGVLGICARDADKENDEELKRIKTSTIL